MAATIAPFVARKAEAATPTVVWQRAGVSTGLGTAIFSADGTQILLAFATGFEVRRSSDGVLLGTITLPSGSLAYNAVAFAPDKTQVALALFQGGTGRIELWAVSTSTLVRTITTDAVRSFKAIAWSSGGLIATQERFAYGGGGFLRVSSAATGALVQKIGPTVHNSSPITLGFSPSGQYLGGADYSSAALKVYRTSDWGTALTFGAGTFVGLFSWSSDSASLWTNGYQRVRLSDGVVLQTLSFGNTYPTSFTPNNHAALASAFDGSGQFTNVIEFLHVPDGAAQVVYTLAPGTVVYAGQVAGTGTLFTYEICPSDCTVYVAQAPPL